MSRKGTLDQKWYLHGKLGGEPFLSAACRAKRHYNCMSLRCWCSCGHNFGASDTGRFEHKEGAMRKAVLIGLVWLALAGRAEAFSWTDVQDTGTKVIKVSGTVLIWTDKALHWSWDVLHNKVVHPAVQVLTLGIVDLDAS